MIGWKMSALHGKGDIEIWRRQVTHLSLAATELPFMLFLLMLRQCLLQSLTDELA